MRTGAKVVGWIVAALLVIVIAIAIFIATFNWNRARPWVDDKVSSAIGRTFTINGDLRVGWRRPPGETGWRSWVLWPHFSAANITIANPDWTKNRNFATLDEIDFDVAVLPLIGKHIVIPSIRLVAPAVDLERLLDGRVNWNLQFASSGQPSAWKLDLRDITLDRGQLTLSDDQKKAYLQAGVDTLGQPIPFGEVMKQQAQVSRAQSASYVGRAGAAQLTRAASAVAASEAKGARADAASAASAAAAASAVDASGAATGTSASTSAGIPTGVSAGAPASAAVLSSAPPAGSSADVSAASTPVVASNTATATAASSADADARSGASAASAVDAAVRSAGPSAVASNGATTNLQPYGIGWTVKGSYNKAAVHGSGKLGGILSVQDATRPYPIQADVTIGKTRIALVGTLTDPVHLAALDLRLWLSATSMANLYPLTGVTLPDSPPFTTEGRLIGQFRKEGDIFQYRNFTGRVGGSDLNGSLTYQQRQPRALLTGDLVSNLLQFSDLAPIIGADSNASKSNRGDATAQPSNKALPVEQFRTDRWKALDADVRFTGKRIIRDPALPIDNLFTHVIMKNGNLTLDPLRFGVAGGTISSNIGLDGNGVPLKGRATISARHLKLKQLFPTFQPMKTSFGELNGDAAVSATGNSVAALLGASNGELKVVMTDGAVSRFLMEAAGLNVANIVLARLFGDKDVKINCAATDFVIGNGVLDSKVFVFDTDDAIINVGGNVNLSSEQMDLSVTPHTKGFRVFSLRSPLYVKGTFKDPHVGVQPLPLLVRGGGALALGLLNPLAALIPLMVPSHGQDTQCGALLSQMQQAPTAPPPGQKTKGRTGNVKGATVPIGKAN